ncbi:targeting protein for Xklp2 homolog [Arctopsyche grandis]|uniref:targeting protein for Xklp2 homolog n=1 Tax=Arctopsyche grandis TaxID=121162 RepID=UPI00406D7D73
MQQWEYNARKCGTLTQSPPRDFFLDPNQFVHEYVLHQNIKIKHEMATPVSDYKRIETEAVVKEEITFHERKQRRRSMSVHAKMQTTKNPTNTVNHLAESMENIKIFSDTRKLDQSNFRKHLGKKSSSVSSLYNTLNKKYVSTAEAIYHLQKDTPERFHSYSKKKEFQWLDASSRKRPQLQSTIPHSPALLSRTRNRPTTALSQKQIEELELEEIRKHKIKAQPIPQFVCRLAPVQRRPVTRPEPFNLTEIRKKPQVNNSPDKGFVARPMPKQIYTSAPVLNKKQIPITIPKSPNITKSQKSVSLEHVASGMSLKNKHNKYEGHTGVPLTDKTKLQPVKPQPFSFEEKDKERQLRKLEKIQKVFEEEKKLREFHANPIPTTVLKKTKMNSSHSPKSCNSDSSKAENKENKPNNINCPTFKARPAIVLSKKPFVPIHKEKVLTEPCQRTLTTEQRAKEREMYDLKMKEKEEICENMRRQREEEERRREEKEVLALRATLVHKAAPIKQYAPIIIHPSSVELTTAKSPNFSHK